MAAIRMLRRLRLLNGLTEAGATASQKTLTWREHEGLSSRLLPYPRKQCTRLPKCPYHVDSALPLTGRPRQRMREEGAFYDFILMVTRCDFGLFLFIRSESLSPAHIQYTNEAVTLTEVSENLCAYALKLLQ